MRTNLTLTRTILAVLFMLIPWMLPGLSPAASQAMGDALPSESKQGIERIATNSVEDSLKACLARIPDDATDGQRLLAVDSCKQEEVVRTLSRIDF